MSTRMTPETTGRWARTAPKTYRHVSGVTVRYRCNTWTWEVVGGADDGSHYSTLWAAQMAATRSET